LQGAAFQFFKDARQLFLRFRKNDRNGLYLGDGCDAPGIAGVDDVALVYQAKSNPA